MFRAMLNAGVNITARKNHSYRVSYYEEDMPPGYDATVYSPNPDLRFVNDTPAYILVMNYFDGENKSLTYELWGTSDGRKSEITNYRQYGARSSPATKYIDDPTLPAGKLIRTETAVPGLNTSFDWKVTRAGQELYGKTFTSIFVPWAAVYRRGTGT
jgi:vancomycin resistance protein YoaR